MAHEKQLFRGDMLAVSLSQSQVEMLKPLFMFVSDKSYQLQRPMLLTILSAVAQMIQEGAAVVRLHTSDHYIFRVIELLRNQQTNATIEELSKKFHVCPTKLKADFKRIAGMPVMTYRNILRLDKARNHLEATDMAVSQIAYICGFSDESYFIRNFRKHYGITPAAFRKHLKENA